MAANPVRGEVSLTLGGEDYVLRPSYEAIVAVERQTECSLSILQLSAAAGTLSAENAAIIVTEFCKAQGRVINDPDMASFDVRRIGKLLYEAGIRAVLPTIAEVLANAISGGYTASGEVKAGTPV